MLSDTNIVLLILGAGVFLAVSVGIGVDYWVYRQSASNGLALGCGILGGSGLCIIAFYLIVLYMWSNG